MVTLTVTEKGYYRRADTGGLDTAAPAVAADLAATAETRGRGDLRTVVGRLADVAGRPVPGRRCPDQRRVLRQHGRQRCRAGRRRPRLRRRHRRGRTRRPCSTGWAPAVALPGHRGGPDRAGHHRRGPGRRRCRARSAGRDGRRRRAATGNGCCEDSFAAAAAALGTRRGAVRRRRRALPADEAAAAQRLSLRAGLPGAGRGLPDRSPRCCTPGGASGWSAAWPPRSRRPCPRSGSDEAKYTDDLVDRFSNPAMRDQLRQIGSDGSLKIGERWLGALRDAARGAARPPRCWNWPWPAGSTPPDPAAPADSTSAPPTPPRRRSPGAGTTADPAALVAALLREVGAADLADEHDLTAAIAQRLPALRAGRIEI